MTNHHRRPLPLFALATTKSGHLPCSIGGRLLHSMGEIHFQLESQDDAITANSGLAGHQIFHLKLTTTWLTTYSSNPASPIHHDLSCQSSNHRSHGAKTSAIHKTFRHIFVKCIYQSKRATIPWT
ncbi:hypothetical protein ACLOJK_007793, partial [Asimina triloba]